MALRLHAVTTIEGPLSGAPHGLRLVPVRELAGAVTDQPAFNAPPLTPEVIDVHRAIVDWLFLAGPVLPAPIGVVFRSEESLTKWLSLHYVALSDGLAFVEDRVAARVHIARANGIPEGAVLESGEPVPLDLQSGDAAAAEAFRELRRKSVAAIPLRPAENEGVVVSSAFLVERDLWKEFESTVEELRRDNETIRVTSSGPWPPYDFIHMQFGG